MMAYATTAVAVKQEHIRFSQEEEQLRGQIVPFPWPKGRQKRTQIYLSSFHLFPDEDPDYCEVNTSTHTQPQTLT